MGDLPPKVVPTFKLVFGQYCKVSNLKVGRDYFKAIDNVIKRMGGDGVMT